MIVQDKAISDIKPYQKNPRHKYDINKVAQSIKEFGFQQPIVVDRAGVIIVGHGRYEAAKSLNLKTIPVTIADLSPEKAKAYRIADNKTNEYSDWDMGLLIQEFTDLLDNNYDLELTGFDSDELEKLIVGEKEGLTDEDAVPETPEEPISKLGDIYKLGEHRLMCGDSTSITDFDKLCSEQADMIFTDPPYGMEYGGGRAEGSTKKGDKVKAHGMIKGDDLKGNDLINLVRDALTTTYLKTKSGASAYICFTWRTYAEFEDALIKAGLKVKNCIVWNKKSIGLGNSHYRPQHEFIFYCGEQWYGDKSQSDVWELSRGDTSKYVHPTQKPVQLIEKAIKNSSKSGDIVIDCFGGSGSTLIACEKTNRKCYMMELDPKYIDRIVKRWEQYTGQKAEKLN
jgi:DNA modification methylase